MYFIQRLNLLSLSKFLIILVAVNFVMFVAPTNASAAPTGSITGPTRVTVGTSATFNASVGNGAGSGYIVLVREDQTTFGGCPSFSSFWCLLNWSAGTSVSASFTPTQTGRYAAMINAYNNSTATYTGLAATECTGNPWSVLPSGQWSNCGASDTLWFNVVPPPPTGLSANCPSPGTTANVSWNGASGATSYNVFTSTTGHAYNWAVCGPTNSCTSGVTGTSTSISGFQTAGNSYQWYVASCNNYGCGDATSGPQFYCTPPYCNTGVSCAGNWSAPANTCYTNNATQTCTYTAYSGGGACTQTSYASYGTINSCNAGYACVSGSCTPIINGSCQTTHNGCATGYLHDNTEYSTFYHWNCYGSNGGANILCGENKSAAPTTNSPSCISGDTSNLYTIYWTGFASYVDISTVSNFASYYNKGVSGTSTTASSGFSGSLTFQPNTTYYVRTFNGTSHSIVGSFTTPSRCSINGSCQATHNGCATGTLGTYQEYDTFYHWNCNGLYGGGNILCSENKPLNGSCSSTHYSCNAGTSASNVSGSTTWTWNCNGLYGGSNTSCSENKPINGSCQATHNGCATGYLHDNTEYSTFYHWNCYGSNGGANILCGENKSAAPTTNSPSCMSEDTSNLYTIYWTGASVSWVDVSTASNFATAYHKNVSGTSTTASSGFNGYAGVSGALTFQPNTTYYVRTFNGTSHSTVGSFTTPSRCPLAAPTNLSADCPVPGTTPNVRWTAASGATSYKIFSSTTGHAYDWTKCGPTNSCEGPVTGTSTSIGTISNYFTGGNSYQWYVASCNSYGCGDATTGPQFTCYYNNAQYISKTCPPANMATGQTANVSVTMKNTGNIAWNTQFGNYYLGSQNPQDNSTWGSRIGASDVAPNASNTYSWSVTAPSTPGIYNFQRRMVQDGVEWFGDTTTPNCTVTVVINGSCRATHNGCATGTLGTTQEYDTFYHWNCMGSNGESSADDILCGENKSAAPTTNSPSCISGDTSNLYTIYWTGFASYVDISTVSDFATYYNKLVSGTSTTASSGFGVNNGYWNGSYMSSSQLTLQPNTTYYTRTFNGTSHSIVRPFTTPNICLPTPTPTPTPLPTPTPIPTPVREDLTCPYGSHSIRLNNGLLSTTDTTNAQLKFSTNGLCVIDKKANIPEFSVLSYPEMKAVYYDKSKIPAGDKVPIANENDIQILANQQKLFSMTGDLTLSKDINVPNSSVAVIFVNGNLFINDDQTASSNNGGLVFVVSGNVNVAPNVIQIDAVIISYGQFCSNWNGSTCASTALDVPLTINGSVISLNASYPPKFVRSLNNNAGPAENITYQPKYLVILKDIFSKAFTVWKEIQ